MEQIQLQNRLSETIQHIDLSMKYLNIVLYVQKIFRDDFNALTGRQLMLF
ncbi:hypothetical protein [Pseudomonas fluorescens]|nr:hypothetical protein [Pseudomonas fluorescens]